MVWAIINFPVAILIGAVTYGALRQLTDLILGFIGIFFFWSNPSKLDGWSSGIGVLIILVAVAAAFTYYIAALRNKEFIRESSV